MTISRLLLFFLLLVPGQVQLFTPSNLSASDFGNTKEEWADLFQLSHQLLFYQSSFDELLAATDSRKLKAYFQSVDSLQRLAGSVLTDDSWIEKSMLGSFKKEIDPLLGTNLENLETHRMFIMLAAEIFPNIQAERADFLESLKQGQVSFVRYLPEVLQAEYRSDTTMLRSLKKKKAIGGTYNYYVKLLRELSPAYEELLATPTIGIDAIADAYISVRAEEQQLELAYHFLHKYRSVNFSGILKEVHANLYDKLIQYRKALSSPQRLWSGQSVSEEQLRAYLSRKNDDWFELREETLQDLRAFTLDVFDYVSKGAVNNLNDYITNNPAVKKYEEEVKKYFQDGADPNHDFIDIKTSPAQSFWVRMRLPSGVLDMIKDNQGTMTNLKGELFLVYKPNTEDQIVDFKDNNQLFPYNVETPEIQEAIRNFRVEVPLGLTIHDVIVSTQNVDTFYHAVLNSTFQETAKVSVGYASKGIWTNFKYNFDELGAFARSMQLPETVGLQLKEVSIDPNTWDPELTFDWNPQGFLTELWSTELSQVKIRLSSVALNGMDLKHALTKHIKDTLASEIQKTLQSHEGEVARLLFSENIKVGPVAFEGEVLQGSIELQPVGYENLLEALDAEEEAFIPVNYRFYVRDGKPAFQFSTPRIPVANVARKHVKAMIAEMVANVEGALNEELQANAVTNLYEGIAFSEVALDIENRTACGGMIFKDLDDLEIPLCYDFSAGRFTYNGLERVTDRLLKEVLMDSISRYAESQFKDKVSQLCGQIPDQLELFGVQWKKKSVQGGNETTIVLLDGVAEATLTCTANDVKLTALDPTPELKSRILGVVKDLLGEQAGFVQLTYPRFEKGHFAIDLTVDPGAVPELAFLAVGPIRAGTVTISAEKEITLNGADLGNLAEATVQKVLFDRLDQELNGILKEALPPKIDFDGTAMIRILEVNSDLKRDQITITGEVDFESLGGFSLTGLKLIIKPSDLSISIDIPNAKNLLLGGIANNFMSSFLESTCDADIGICDAVFNEEKLELTGVIKINITDFITFPGIRFTLTPKKFDYTFNPQIVFQGEFPLGPGIVAIDPTLEFDFKAEKITGRTIITTGAGKEARETAKVAKVVTRMDVSLSNLGRIDAEGTLKLLQVLPVYHGEGYIELKTASFGLKEGTVGLLDQVMHFERKLNFYGNYPGKKPGTFEGTGEFDFLGMEARARIDGRIKPTYAQIDGSGSIKIPLVALNGQISTRYVPAVPMSHLLYGRGALSGQLKVSSFKLSTLETRVSIHRVSAAFTVLGARLGLTVPVAEALTEGKILNLILEMFEFNLEDMAEFLKSLKNVGDAELSIDFGATEDIKGSKKGREDGGGKEGRSVTTKDDIFEDFEGTAADPGDAVIVNLGLDIQKVNKTETRTIRVYKGRRCKGFDFFDNCIGGTEAVYDYKTITEQTFKFDSWPNHWRCLPDSFQEYYALYHLKESHPVSGKRVEDLIHPTVGDRLKVKDQNDDGIIPFMMRTALKADAIARRISEGNYLCLSKEDHQMSNPTDHCIEVSSIPEKIYNKVKFYGNLAYKNEKAYIFTSAKLPDSKEAFCVESTANQTFSVADILDRKRNNESLIELQCLNCTEVSVSGNTLQKRMKLTGLSGYVKTGRVPRKDVPAGFTPINGQVNKILDDFYSIFSYKQDSSSLTAADSAKVVELDKSADQLRDFTRDDRDFPEGSLVLFDRGRMILVNKQTSKFRISVPQVADQNTLSRFYELTGKVWLEIDQKEFLQLFQGYLDTRELTVKAVFDSLKINKGRLLAEMKPTLDEYIQNWVYYGKNPRTIEVETTSPRYNFTVWNYTDLEGNDQNFTYTFSRLTSDNNPLNLAETNHYKLHVSDLIDSMQIVNKSLNEHRVLLEEEFESHVYRNLLFFHAKDTLPDRALLSASEDRVVFGLKDSTILGEGQQYRLVIINPGAVDFVDYRNKVQLHTLGFNITSSSENIDIDLENHRPFYQLVMNKLEENPEAEAFVQQFPGDGFTYRAVVFEGAGAELIWEEDSVHINSGFKSDSFEAKAKQLTRGDVEEFYGKKLFLSPEATRSEQAQALLTWFDGFDAWYSFKGNVNPASLLNDTYHEN